MCQAGGRRRQRAHAHHFTSEIFFDTIAFTKDRGSSGRWNSTCHAWMWDKEVVACVTATASTGMLLAHRCLHTQRLAISHHHHHHHHQRTSAVIHSINDLKLVLLK